ncbi:MAG: hypothetical protein K8F25_11565 [Fimbriimonadaceae bacterium]|nr:hypothetical protein [Alphaproteobacteria bacterium]
MTSIYLLTGNSELQDVVMEALMTNKNTNSRTARIVKILAYLVFLLVCTEIGVRIYWMVNLGYFFIDGRNAIYNYQELLHETGVFDAEINDGDGFYDVLILGGSVVSKDFGNIGTYLKSELDKTGKNTRIWNGAEAAHTSRDSWEKYRNLKDKNFDLVIIYHAVNESRFNNVPSDSFKNDYSHVSWYQQINSFNKHWEVSFFMLPFTIDKILIRLKVLNNEYIGRHDGLNELSQYGNDIKSAVPFRNYMSLIAQEAGHRGEKLVFVTYSLFVPLEANTWLNTELFGLPENILSAVTTHNEITRAIAHDSPHVDIVEMASNIPSTRQHFIDAVHLTDLGAKVWVENFKSQMKKLFN